MTKKYLNKGMTKKELIETIKDAPDDAIIFYRDMDYGGKYEEVDSDWIEYDKENNVILVESADWDYVD